MKELYLINSYYLLVEANTAGNYVMTVLLTPFCIFRATAAVWNRIQFTKNTYALDILIITILSLSSTGKKINICQRIAQSPHVQTEILDFVGKVILNVTNCTNVT